MGMFTGGEKRGSLIPVASAPFHSISFDQLSLVPGPLPGPGSEQTEGAEWVRLSMTSASSSFTSFACRKVKL